MGDDEGVLKKGRLQHCEARDLNDDFHHMPDGAPNSMRGSPWRVGEFTLTQNGKLLKGTTRAEEVLLNDVKPLLKIYGRDWFDDQDLTILNLGWKAFESCRQMSFCLQFPRGVRQYFCVDGASQEQQKKELEEWTAALSKVLCETRPLMTGKPSTFSPADNVITLFAGTFIKQKGGKCIGSWHERYVTVCSDGFMRFHHKEGQKPYKIWYIPTTLRSCRFGQNGEGLLQSEITQKVDMCTAVRVKSALMALDVTDVKGKHLTYYFYPTNCSCSPEKATTTFANFIKRLIHETSDKKPKGLDVYVITEGYPSDVGLDISILPYEMQVVLGKIYYSAAGYTSGYFIVLSDGAKYVFRNYKLRVQTNDGVKEVETKSVDIAGGRKPPTETLKHVYSHWPSCCLLNVNESDMKFEKEFVNKDFTAMSSVSLPLVLDMDSERTAKFIQERKAAEESRQEEKRKKEAEGYQIRRHDWSEEKAKFTRYHQAPTPKASPGGGSGGKSPKGGANDFQKEQMKMMKQQQKFMEKQQKKMFKEYQKNMEEQMEGCVDIPVDPNVYIPGIQDCGGGAYIVEGCM